MAKLYARLLSWMDVNYPVESLEDDVKAVEDKLRASVKTLYLLRYDSKSIKDESQKKRADEARSCIGLFCEERKINIEEILVAQESAKTDDELFTRVQNTLMRNRDRVRMAYVNINKRDRFVKNLWNYCKVTDLFCGGVKFIGERIESSCRYPSEDVSLARIISEFMQNEDAADQITLRLISESVEAGKDTFFVPYKENRRGNIYDFKQDCPDFGAYYITSVISLKDYTFLRGVNRLAGYALYFFSKKKPKSVFFFRLCDSLTPKYWQVSYFGKSLELWMNHPQSCPRLLARWANDVPYERLNKNHVEALFNRKNAIGFRKAIAKVKPTRMKDISDVIGYSRDDADRSVPCNGFKLIHPADVRSKLELDKVPVCEVDCNGFEVFGNDIIMDLSVKKGPKFYLLPGELSERFFVSKLLGCIHLTDDTVDPQKLCDYLNSEQSLARKYFSYMTTKITAEDIGDVPYIESEVADTLGLKGSQEQDSSATVEENVEKMLDGASDGERAEVIPSVHLKRLMAKITQRKEKMANAVSANDYEVAMHYAGFILETLVILWCSYNDEKNYFDVDYRATGEIKKMKMNDGINRMEKFDVLGPVHLSNMRMIQKNRNVESHPTLMMHSDVVVSKKDYEEACKTLNWLENECRRWLRNQEKEAGSNDSVE